VRRAARRYAALSDRVVAGAHRGGDGLRGLRRRLDLAGTRRRPTDAGGGIARRMTETAIAVATSPAGRRWRVAYFTIAVLAAVVVAFANESISGFLAASPLNASVALIVLLPFLAIATRPVYVRVAQRNESHRTIGIIWALRTHSFRFFARTIGVWLLLMLVFGASSVAMF